MACDRCLPAAAAQHQVAEEAENWLPVHQEAGIYLAQVAVHLVDPAAIGDQRDREAEV